MITVTYTDKGGPGGIVPLTGRGQVILQPKTKQAEFYASTGRIPGAATTGDPGVVTEDAADDQGGGKDIGFIDDGDYVSYKPVNLTNLTELRFRVASAGDGGTIEVHLDSPSGTLVGTTANITPTGGWQTYKTVSLPLTNPPAGTHELFLVFRKPRQHQLADEHELARVHRQGRRGHRRAGRDRRAPTTCPVPPRWPSSSPPRPPTPTGRRPTSATPGTSACPAPTPTSRRSRARPTRTRTRATTWRR